MMNSIFNRLGVAKETRLQNDISAMMDWLDIEMNTPAARTGAIIFQDASSPAITYGEGLIARQMSLLSLLSQGLLDAAIVGSDALVEYNSARSSGPSCHYIGAIGTTQKSSRFAVACRDIMTFTGLDDLNGQCVVTSQPATLAFDLSTRGVTPARIVEAKGDAEIVARLMDAPYVADIVETGNSLRANGYREAQALRNVRTVVAVSPDQYEEYGRMELEILYSDFLTSCRAPATQTAPCVAA